MENEVTEKETQKKQIPGLENQHGANGLIKCLNCGHENIALSVDCIKCGIVFSKYYEMQEEILKDDPDRVQELEKLIQTKENHKALMDKKLQERRQEALRKEKEEKERLEILRKKREQKEALQKARQKMLREKEEEKADQKLIEKEEEKTKRDALPDGQEEKADLHDLQAIESQEGTETIRESATGMETIRQFLKPKATLKRLLKSYMDQLVGINYDFSIDVKSARLANINNDYFSILVEEDGVVISFPFTNIHSIIESVKDVSTETVSDEPTHPLIIRMLTSKG